MFLQMWDASVHVTPKSTASISTCRIPAPEKEAGYVIPYGDCPLDRERVGEMVYMDILNRARRYVHIMTPYLIIDSEMITALTYAARARRGCPAHPAACAGQEDCLLACAHVLPQAA